MVSVAEHVVMQILALVRNYIPAYHMVRVLHPHLLQTSCHFELHLSLLISEAPNQPHSCIQAPSLPPTLMLA